MRAYHFQCFLQNPLYSRKFSSSLSSFTAHFVTLDMLSKLKKSLIAWDFPGDAVVKWCEDTSNAGRTGSIPDQGTKIPHATWQRQKKIF